MDQQNYVIETTLENLESEKETYAQFCLDSPLPSRSIYGGAENHSSALCYLNDGNKKGNDYCEEPHTLVKD